MRQLTFALLTFCFSFLAVAPSVEAGCARCIEARKNNEKNKNTYFYYDDYVKSQNKSH